jgi:N-acetylneuraminate synthase
MNGEKLLKAVKKDQPLTIDDIDGPYSDNDELKKLIYTRGIDHNKEEDKTNL